MRRPTQNTQVCVELPQFKTRKVRLFPTAMQRKTLLEWFGVARYVYNSCVHLVRQGVALSSLRALCVYTKAFQGKPKLRWVTETPQPIRDVAYHDFEQGFKTALASNRPFEMKFRKKKDKIQSIGIAHREWNRTRGHFEFLSRIRSAEEFSAPIHDFRIVKDEMHCFYICIPETLKVIVCIIILFAHCLILGRIGE